MSYQIRGLQLSLLIHAAVFVLITSITISEFRLGTPVVIDLGIIKEVVEAPAAVPPEEKKIEEKPPVDAIVPLPQRRWETIQNKGSVRAKRLKDPPKKIARGGKKEAPPVRQEEQTAPPGPALSQPADAHNTLLASAFSEDSAVAVLAPGGSGGGSSNAEGIEGGTGPSKSGSGSGSGAGGLANLTFGSALAPKYRHKEIPVYPSMARRLEKEGKVVLGLTIDENGSLVNIEVVEDARYGFADAAIAAVKKSTFIPSMMNGKPIRARALLTVKFTLR